MLEFISFCQCVFDNNNPIQYAKPVYFNYGIISYPFGIPKMVWIAFYDNA